MRNRPFGARNIRSGVRNRAWIAGPSSPASPGSRAPAIESMTPFGETRRMRLLPESAMRTFPLASTFTSVGRTSDAVTAGRKSSLENASPDFSKSVNNIPPIDTQRAVTQVLVNNGDTTVIGGIYVSSEQTNRDGTPGLSRLPLLGWLFQRNGVNDESRELLIFITPRILTL